MPYSSLRCIVRRLELWNVHNVPAHTGCRNEATVGEALKLILLLVVRDLALDHGSLRPWDAHIRDEDVKSVVEFF